MSLLMEALKKAEQAKRKATDGPAAPAPGLTLELTPADAIMPTPKPESLQGAKPASAAAPALTAAAYTLMTGRAADNSPSVASLETHAAASTPMQIEAAPAPKSAPAAPQITSKTLKMEPSLDRPPPTRAAPIARNLPARRGLSAVWTGGAIALLCALAGGGYWYYNSMAQYLMQQATLGAPQTALATAAEPPPAAAAPLPAVPPAADKIPPRAPVKIKPASKPPRVEITPLALASVPLNPSAAGVPAPVIAAPGPVAPPASDAAVNTPVVPPEPLGISRDTQQNDIFAALQTAYRAYQSGDDTGAQNLYSRVLSRDEHNRDALLGLAAIAVRQKDFVRAQEIYSELLTLDPKDSIAQAGFVSVSGSFDPLQQEARIKALLEQEPGASHLLFTYATFLMQQQRWLEASRTLLPAVQAQRDNADYAFNLAVCFDHLGQADAAVKYYRAALELAAKQSTRFRPADVQQRLQAMGAPGRGGLSP